MLDTERQKRLGEIGFEWGLTYAAWDETYALLQKFKSARDIAMFHSRTPRMEQILVCG
jgi:hypothetical protein